jgi:murein DD-endopeptidase MepM/ murein hydrolase activator NlpD
MAVSAPVRRVIFTVNESKKRVSQGRESIKNIGQVILKRTKVKREAFAQTNIFRKRREESEKRQELESELESPKVVARLGGPQQLTQETGVGGFFDRIFGFIGYLSAGWIMNNLPTWIGMGKEFVARIQRAGEIVSGFFNNTVELFRRSLNVLSSLGKNILSFDFFDTSNRLEKSFDSLNLTITDMGRQFEESLGLATTPLTEGKYSGQEIPEVGTQQTNEGAYTEPPPYSGSAPPSGLFELIAGGEGGYESMNRGEAGDSLGGAKKYLGKNLQDMTLSEIMSLQSRGRVFAVGKYQIVTGTMPGFVRWLQSKGYDPKTTKYSAKIQDLYPQYTIESKRPQVGKFLSGSMNDIQKANLELAAEFASVGVPFDMKARSYGGGYPIRDIKKGESLYSGRARNRASITPEKVQQALKQARESGGNIKTLTRSTQQQSQIRQVPPGNINPTIGDRLGAGRGHGGVDLQVKNGTPLRAVSDGVIVDSDYEKGWGNFLVMKDNLGIYHLYGHMQPGYKRSGSVKKGEVIGKVGMTGRTTGPHLHWETGTGWNGGRITGRFDALSKYSKYAPFNTSLDTGVSVKAPTPTPAQIAAAPQQSAMVPFSLTPERKGQNIVIIDQPRQQQNIITSAASGGGPTPSPISDFDLLNNFIKNKLLLDLAYL